MSENHNLILGIDGGGTKTVACLAQVVPDGSFHVVGRGQSGSSNLKAVGPEKALENLAEALDQAWSDAQVAPESVSLAVLGLSGAGRPEAQSLLQQWNTENRIAHKLSIVHDALPVLAAGTPDGSGVALIAGTGSVAFAADSNRKTAVVGGWGYWFGDEGSAFWLGQAALRAASLASDGRSPATQLLEAILDRLSISDPREMLTSLARCGDVRSAIAGLADLVSIAADQQDTAALEIVSQAAGHLAALVVAAAKQLELGMRFPLALAGGVLSGSQLIREALLGELAARGVSPDSVQLVTDPVNGCLKVAMCEITSQSSA
ncbi:N-acetylglucosamine kinase [Bythopirellula goksoeyrii]|uniref:Glucosamine kinase GspK n=1 Tax=Bythopirellula goksoeyrii TaxID=1400387 RepID=A0A5B9QDL7_9BACT|nr:BadF/BadG/BcrA/BcrD ATPase family protein [Bythopirellula goksoeyrii]QEG37167.1 Glucosamine kinase GspK [Bythopirellula goksoeyrii]